jgi:hypothetical protein
MNNLIRLTGYIKIQHIDNIDVMDGSNTNKSRIKTGIDNYRDSISQISEMIKWRNKVSGHFASTDPRADDNIATLFSSHSFPISWDSQYKRYKTGQLISGIPQPDGSVVNSEIPIWSVTEVYELLDDRFNLRS